MQTIYITPKTEKKLSKVNCKINSVDINFLVNSSTRNIIDTEKLEKILKVCKIGLEITKSNICMFGSNNPLKLKGQFNATTKNIGFKVYIWFYVIDQLKTGNFVIKKCCWKSKNSVN